jgi:uncharacterized membrane protein YdbT with pleckstrin-like domain
MSLMAERLPPPGETVVLHTRPHWRRVAPAAAVLLVVAPAASYLAARVPPGAYQGAIRWAVAGLAGIVLVRWAVWPFLVWMTTTYTVTTRRVVVRRGVLARHGADVPLSRVGGISFAQRGLVDRALRTGTLVLEAVGEQGPLVLADVPAVAVTQRELARLAATVSGGLW